MAAGVVFAEGLPKSDRVSQAAWKERRKACRPRLGSSAQELVPSHPRARFRTRLLKVHGPGPAPGVSALSQNPRAPAWALPQVFTVASTPFSRKSSRKGMQSRRRPSVTCSWAASRTRRQVSDMPCRSVPPSSVFLPLPLPPFPCVPVSDPNDDHVCI